MEELRQWLFAEVCRLLADGTYPRSIHEDADALVAVPKNVRRISLRHGI